MLGWLVSELLWALLVCKYFLKRAFVISIHAVSDVPTLYNILVFGPQVPYPRERERERLPQRNLRCGMEATEGYPRFVSVMSKVYRQRTSRVYRPR